MPWFVVTEAWVDGNPDPEDKVWTVSQNLKQSGWNTDCGYPGYGMAKIAAQFLVDAANEKEAREGIFPMMVGDWQYKLSKS